MTMNAGELADLIIEKRARAEQRAYESLEKKITSATAQMVRDLEFNCTVDLDDDDQMAVTKVTEDLRDLGYKFRFMSEKDSKGELTYQLLISIDHLK